ncbi:DMT family transporter [Jannaschia sp. W003]|uniref:DMT family transporter n=1 Tax=Jannaschia sp. W003 TaxID=2867012 RepID=UPI0021A77F12|nr:DMT family transporter [Jannaschia sp. W003]UWQ21814.1 DMT family transporter [Jannaschia sp. W003]
MDRDLLLSVALMLAAMTLIPLGDTAGKLLTGSHGVDPGFVAFARFAVGAAMILLILGGRIEWRIWRDPRLWLRAALIAAGIASILTALRTEPIADVFGAFFVGPIVSYALSAWLLGERASLARSALLALGFAGVLLVVRPGFGMSPGLGWALLAGLFYGGYLAASRWVAGVAGPRQLMLTQTALGTLMLLPFGATSAVPALTVPVVGLLLVSGLASATGNLLLVNAYGRTGATVLAPFVYFQLVAATGLGWAVFGTLPDGPATAGLALLALSGLATLALRR